MLFIVARNSSRRVGRRKLSNPAFWSPAIARVCCFIRAITSIWASGGLVQRSPKVIRTDNGPEFAGRTMRDWAARNGIELRFIQPGKPVQNAYIESFNSRFRDECLSQH